MSQFPHDRLNKNLFERCLSDFGEVILQRSVQAEAKFIDIFFTPRVPIELTDRIKALSVEALGEALLDFREMADLVAWLGEGWRTIKKPLLFYLVRCDDVTQS